MSNFSGKLEKAPIQTTKKSPKNIEVHASGDIVLTFEDGEAVILTDVEVGRRGPGADRLAQIVCDLWPLKKAEALEWIKLASYPESGSVELFSAAGLPTPMPS